MAQDREGRWAAGPALDWLTLPARVEGVIAERLNCVAQPLQAALRVGSVEGELLTAELEEGLTTLAEARAFWWNGQTDVTRKRSSTLEASA